MSKIKLTRLACTFNPASVSAEYTQDGGKTKQYKQFPVVFGPFSEPAALYETLVTDYPEYFGKSAISANKLKNFVSMINKKAPSIDLTNLSREQVDKYKQQMNREFEMNAIKPGDPNFQYDMRVDFPEADEPCDWD